MKSAAFVRAGVFGARPSSSSSGPFGSSWLTSSSNTAGSSFGSHRRFVSSFVPLNDGSRIPQVGLGTWKSPKGQVGAAVAAALDAGYRHIDCALVYQNENEIGDALSRKFSSSGLKRGDVFITGKIWNTFHSQANAREGLSRSLRSLQTPYLDLLLIHYPMGFDESAVDAASRSGVIDGDVDAALLYPTDADGRLRFSEVDFLETYAAMESMVVEGRVRSIGVSNFNIAQMERVLNACSIKPVTNQVEVHPYFVNADLISFCQSRDVVITAYSPLGSPDRPNAKSGDPVLLRDPVVNKIADERKRTPAQILIRFGIELGLVVIPKSVTLSRIGENFGVFDFSLSTEEMKHLKSLDKGAAGRTCCALVAKDHPMWPFRE